jgi:energy-coupling factor transporter ATP-binding protein EcfA2
MNLLVEKESFDLINNLNELKRFLNFQSNSKDDYREFQPIIIKLDDFFKSESFREYKYFIPLEENTIQKMIHHFALVRVSFTNNIEKINAAKVALTSLPFLETIDFLMNAATELNKNAYLKWMDEKGEFLNSLIPSFESNNLEPKDTRSFERKFRSFFGDELFVRVKNIRRTSGNLLECTPLILHNGVFEEMPHPVTKGTWLISGKQDTLNANTLNKIKRGNILVVQYTSVYSPHFRKSFITIDFENVKILPHTLESVLLEEFPSEIVDEMYKALNITKGKENALINTMIQVVTTSYQKYRDELRAVEEEKEAICEKIEENRHDIVEKQKFLTDEKKEWYEIIRRIKYLTDESNLELETNGSQPYNSETWLDDLQTLFYFIDDSELLYDKTIIDAFTASLRANVLTILTGPSGTGKSSLVEAFGKAIANIKVTMIPVQSSWTDAQDLLGYFHPNEKSFIPTQFMEALAEARLAAKANLDQIFIICLDEMNLAHIEYYFAQLLSAREQSKPSIQLYPKRYEVRAIRILNGEISATEEEKIYANELIERFPSHFEIPSNVRFVGTLNMDHTVKPLSPKVIDRSFILELLNMDSDSRQKVLHDIQKHGKQSKIKISLDQFNTPIQNVNDAVIQNIIDISDMFKEFPNVPLNSRGLKHIKAMAQFRSGDQQLWMDQMIKGKILPRVEVKKLHIQESIKTFEKELAPYKKASKKFTKMLETNHTVSFW